MTHLALFDFDGTITTRGSFVLFLRYVLKGGTALRFKMIYLIPVLLAMVVKVVPESKAKEALLSTIFKGWTKKQFDTVAAKFAETVLPGIIRPIALEKIDYHRKRGDKIVVVSASLDSWIDAWCRKYQVESLCSILETKNGLITGKLVEGDCTGKEKVRRIRAKYDLRDYDVVIAYGDSYRDKEMLELADVAYYKWKTVKKQHAFVAADNPGGCAGKGQRQNNERSN